MVASEVSTRAVSASCNHGEANASTWHPIDVGAGSTDDGDLRSRCRIATFALYSSTCR